MQRYGLETREVEIGWIRSSSILPMRLVLRLKDHYQDAIIFILKELFLTLPFLFLLKDKNKQIFSLSLCDVFYLGVGLN